MTDATAEKHDAALAVVQRLLKVQGVHSYAVHTIALKPAENGKPWPLSQRTRYAPELVVHGEAGWLTASVSIGTRSGCYLVSLRNGPGLQTVRREQPEKVVNLVLGAQPGGRA
ncbi:hypothetical protein OG884_12670 [Streptosporangium sp. NBC_01755]|uniref:hypothetical protein n=1 Tax=Streptosporangium sp. NBC_01755 TaxID=2975949 RepID=UPI002DD849E4|nr:hypothetical protein [Streptosporangium sp. NBC_01755]WSD02711.1 hypothetical protein OG884_12670 [Streptosporangium sp. NBC_01755]